MTLPPEWADDCPDLEAAGNWLPHSAVRIAAMQAPLVAAGDRFGLPLEVLNGLAWVESAHNPRAVSKAGARGLLQLMPATGAAAFKALDMPDADPFDPRANALAGAWYLARLLKRWGGKWEWALASYYAGPGNVKKHGPGRWLWYVRAVQRETKRFLAAAQRCQGVDVPLPGPTPRPKRPTKPKPPPPVARAGAGLFVLAVVVALALGMEHGSS